MKFEATKGRYARQDGNRTFVKGKPRETAPIWLGWGVRMPSYILMALYFNKKTPSCYF